MLRRAFLLSAVGAAIVFPAPTASAQRIRIRPRPGGKVGGPTGRVLNRAQLQHCVSTDKSLTARSSELDRLERELDAKGASIDRLGAEIDRKRPSVDLSNGNQVDAFNVLIAEHDRQVVEYNSRLGSVEALTARYNTDIATYNAQCADAEYYESDMRAIQGN